MYFFKSTRRLKKKTKKKEMSLLFPTFSKNTQKKSAGTAVLNAAIRSDKPHAQQAANSFIHNAPPVRRIANVMMHIPEGRSGSRHFSKASQKSALHRSNRGPQSLGMFGHGTGLPPPAHRPERLHAHEVMRKYNKPINNGIVAHRAVYGGQSSSENSDGA